MAFFDKLREPVFYKDDSRAEAQLAALMELSDSASGKAAEAIQQEIRNVKAGIDGEKQIRFELAHSHMPMYILHDLFLRQGDLTAQIDYLIITRYHQFVIECKNLYGNIEIDDHGNFSRFYHLGNSWKKEGIYSPVTQNRRHLDMIRVIRAEQKNFLSKGYFEKHFYENYRSIVVLANPKSVLNDSKAPKDVRNQVIKADQLVEYIRNIDAKADYSSSDKEMEALADYFMQRHEEQQEDYGERFRKMLKDAEAVETETKNHAENNVEKDLGRSEKAVMCPRCGGIMVLRRAKKGPNAGEEFYGCSNFPKCRMTMKTINHKNGE